MNNKQQLLVETLQRRAGIVTTPKPMVVDNSSTALRTGLHEADESSHEERMKNPAYAKRYAKYQAAQAKMAAWKDEDPFTKGRVDALNKMSPEERENTKSKWDKQYQEAQDEYEDNMSKLKSLKQKKVDERSNLVKQWQKRAGIVVENDKKGLWEPKDLVSIAKADPEYIIKRHLNRKQNAGRLSPEEEDALQQAHAEIGRRANALQQSHGKKDENITEADEENPKAKVSINYPANHPLKGALPLKTAQAAKAEEPPTFHAGEKTKLGDYSSRSGIWKGKTLAKLKAKEDEEEKKRKEFADKIAVHYTSTPAEKPKPIEPSKPIPFDPNKPLKAPERGLHEITDNPNVDYTPRHFITKRTGDIEHHEHIPDPYEMTGKVSSDKIERAQRMLNQARDFFDPTINEGGNLDIDPEQLRMGIEVEMEHTDDPKVAELIAIDHLTKDSPTYYNKLKKANLQESMLRRLKTWYDWKKQQ